MPKTEHISDAAHAVFHALNMASVTAHDAGSIRDAFESDRADVAMTAHRMSLIRHYVAELNRAVASLEAALSVPVSIAAE